MTREKFKKLFDDHFDTVRNYIYYRCGDEELATDITQDAFLKIWEKQNLLELSSNTKGLLFKIAGDMYVSSYRKQKSAHNFRLKFKEGSGPVTPHDTLQYTELKTKYELALTKLPENQRVVFLMNRIEDMKYREIATTFGISVKAVEKRMSKALSFLKNELNY